LLFSLQGIIALFAFEGINPSRLLSLEGFLPSKAVKAFFISLGA